MTIEKANTDSEADDDFFQDEGSDSEYNMRELMDQVYKLKDIIITLPTDQVALLKSGLINRKAKDNVKMKEAGLPPDPNVLSFLVYPAKDKQGEEIPGLSDARVKLGPKKSVTVFEIRKPSDDF